MTEKPGKSEQPKVATVKLRAGGGFHGSEKTGWSVGGIEKQPGNEKLRVRKK